MKFLTLTLAFALLGAGCATKTPSAPPQSTTPVHHEEMAGGHGAATKHLSRLAGSRIDLKEKKNLKPGDVLLAFKLYGLDGHEFGPSELRITHEKLMHLIVTSADLSFYTHLHPEYTAGRWTVRAPALKAGSYEMYVDIDPEEEEPTVLRVPLVIGSATTTPAFPEVTKDRKVQSGPVQAELVTTSVLRTNEETALVFRLTDRSGKAVGEIGKYLGAYGHVVMIRHRDTDDFFHVHNVEEQPKDGQVRFAAVFPEKGRYTLFAQFNVAGEVRTFPITVEVNEESASGSGESGHHGE